MEKSLNYTLDLDGVSPTEPSCAGYQGEHRATAITFTPTAKLSAEISKRQGKGSVFSVRTEFITEAGERFSSEEVDVLKIGEPFFITGEMSESGLDARVFICITETDINGNKSEFLRGNVSLYFISGSGYGSVSSKEREVDLIEEKTAEALILIEGKCAEAEGIVSEGVRQMQAIKTSSADQVRRAVVAADLSESYIVLVRKAADICTDAVTTVRAETENAKQYCIYSGDYSTAAAESAKTAENAAYRAEETLVQTQLCGAMNEEYVKRNLACVQSCNTAAETSDNAANESKKFAEEAKEYSLSAVNDVKNYIDSTFGDVGAALDSIIASQQGYIGGSSV